MKKGKNIVINLSGRGDKDLNTVARIEGIEIWVELIKLLKNQKKMKKPA